MIRGHGQERGLTFVERTRVGLRGLSLVCMVLWGLTSLGQGGVTAGQGPPPAIAASLQANNVAVITIRGEITSVTTRSVERRLKLAERAGADAVVIDLDTPGGDLPAVLGICDAIKRSSITNSTAWINPNAYSGGAIIALACKRIVTNKPATMGDALIIATDMIGRIQSMPEHERQKFLSPLMAEIVASARENGYDEMLVQGIVSRGVELWLVENPNTGQRVTINAAEFELVFGEPPTRGSPRLPSARSSGGEVGPPEPTRQPQGGFVAPNVREPPPTRAVRPAEEGDPRRFNPASPNLAPMAKNYPEEQLPASRRHVFTAADRGKWSLIEYVSTGDGPFVFKDADLADYGLSVGVIRNDEELKKYLGAKNMLRMDQNWSEGLVGVMTSWPMRALLIVVFLIALFLSMTQPGMMLPEAVVAGALIALIAPPMLINLANWWEVAAIVAGIILIALELFVIPGFGVIGILGILALFGGLIGTFIPEGGGFPDTPGERTDMLYGLATLVLAVTTAGVGIYFITKHFGSLPLFGKLMLKSDPVLADRQESMLGAMAIPMAPVKVGAVGRAVSPLRPSGRAEINGRIADVVAGMGYVPAGAPVVVTEVTAFRVTVERAPEPPRSGPAGGTGGRAA